MQITCFQTVSQTYQFNTGQHYKHNKKDKTVYYYHYHCWNLWNKILLSKESPKQLSKINAMMKITNNKQISKWWIFIISYQTNHSMVHDNAELSLSAAKWTNWIKFNLYSPYVVLQQLHASRLRLSNILFQDLPSHIYLNDSHAVHENILIFSVSQVIQRMLPGILSLTKVVQDILWNYQNQLEPSY